MTDVHEFDITLPDGRTLHGYDTGGGPHALAAAALQPARVIAVVALAGLAPRDAVGLDWFAGMGPTSTASLRAAENGLEGKRLHERENADAPIDFIAHDWVALAGPWGWLGEVAAAGIASGIDALIHDDIAFVTPWGVDLADVMAPVLLMHGTDDHVVPPTHSSWLATQLSSAELWLVEGESHISALADDEHGADAALRWLAAHVRG